MSIILTQKDIELIKKNINKKFPEQIKTKLKNINKARAGGHLGTKRVSQNSRILLMYETICKNNLSLVGCLGICINHFLFIPLKIDMISLYFLDCLNFIIK